MAWLRVVAGALIGFIVYATGLMGAVFLWFMRRDDPIQGIEHGFNVVLLLALAVVASQVTHWIAGKRRRASLTGLLLLILGVGILNISLGRAIEPSWFTVLEMVTASAVLFARLFRKAAPAPDPTPAPS